MDADRFDRLARSLSVPGTRRGLVRLLAALPLGVMLTTLLGDGPEATAKDDDHGSSHRRHRRKARHRHRPGQHKDNPTRKRKRKGKGKGKPKQPAPSTPALSCASDATTCTGKCATVINNCGLSVDCGPCECAPCATCTSCNRATGRCDPAFEEQPCGPGQICQAGTCACKEDSCAGGQRCDGTACVCDDQSCATGCCDDAGTCHIDDNAACGTNGGVCIPCTGPGQSCGAVTSGQCGCSSQGCGSQTCGSVVDNCGNTIPCAGCAGCCAGSSCAAGTERTACGSGGIDCQSCSGVCVNGSCTTCSAANACPSGLCCANGQCVASCPACLTCTGGQCVADPSQNRTDCAGTTGATSICCNGTCCPGCCDSDGTCGACRVFVTSSQNASNMGGLMGADGRCQALAEIAGRPGTYQAWLSDTTGSPSSRFRCTQASCSTQGYVLVNGTPVATDWADLTDGSLAHAINLTEGQTPGPPVSALVWTNTRADGTPGGSESAPDGDCANWGSGGSRGNSGSSSSTDPTWTDFTIGFCNSNQHKLYCFQQR